MCSDEQWRKKIKLQNKGDSLILGLEFAFETGKPGLVKILAEL